MLLLQLLYQLLVFLCFWPLYLFHEVFLLKVMPTGQEKKAIAPRFESNCAKAYADRDIRQRLDVGLAVFAMAVLICSRKWES